MGWEQRVNMLKTLNKAFTQMKKLHIEEGLVFEEGVVEEKLV